MPEVWRIRSWIVIWRLAGTVSAVGSPASRTATRMLANFGKYLLSGSSIRILPCSYSIKAPTAVIGLVIEAILKMVSVVMATPAALSRQPYASRATSLPCRAMAMTAPGIRSASMSAFSVALIRPSRKRAGKAWSREFEWQPWVSPVQALRPLVFCERKTRATRLQRPAAFLFVLLGADCAPAHRRIAVRYSRRFSTCIYAVTALNCRLKCPLKFRAPLTCGDRQSKLGVGAPSTGPIHRRGLRKASARGILHRQENLIWGSASMFTLSRRNFLALTGSAAAATLSGRLTTSTEAAMGPADKFDLVIKGGDVLDPR